MTKKRFFRGMLALALTFGMSVIGCEVPPGSDAEPTVTGVTVSPKTPVAEAGDALAFTATVSGTNSPAQTVTWAVSRPAGTLKAGTAFTGATLNLASDEATGPLIVTATSTVDTAKSDTATVTVYATGTKPTVTSVGVSPTTASVAKGAAQSFTATVSGTNSPAQTVTWSVSGGGSGTAISTGGILSVASGESAAALTVRATSTVNTAKSGTAAVTLTGGGNGDSGSINNYSIGDTGPAGGIVFYVDTADVYPGWTYLEAAPTDVGVYKWGTGVYSSSLIGTSTAMGTGASNTATIVSTAGVDAPAAKACSDYIYGGKSDWFLPSKDELNLMFDLKTVIGGFDYVTLPIYWSSSEHDAYTTWQKGFTSGTWIGNGVKEYSWRVRAIRAF